MMLRWRLSKIRFLMGLEGLIDFRVGFHVVTLSMLAHQKADDTYTKVNKAVGECGFAHLEAIKGELTTSCQMVFHMKSYIAVMTFFALKQNKAIFEKGPKTKALRGQLESLQTNISSKGLAVGTKISNQIATILATAPA